MVVIVVMSGGCGSGVGGGRVVAVASAVVGGSGGGSGGGAQLPTPQAGITLISSGNFHLHVDLVILKDPTVICLPPGLEYSGPTHP